MARKRMIDPDIWTDEKVLELSWQAVPFYIGLITQSDDEGRLRFSPTSLRAKICPRGDITAEQVEAWMWECVEVGLVLVYEAEDTLFAYLPGWLDYQKVQHPAASRIPEPPENIREVSRELTKAHESSRNFVNPHESSPQIRSIRLDRSGGGKGAQARQARTRISREDLPTFGELEPDVQAYVANAAAENKSGEITTGRELSMRRELQQLQQELGESFLPALREANKNGAPNANYIRKVAASSERRGSVTPLRPASGSEMGFRPDRIFR